MTLLPTINGLGTTWWIEIFDELTDEKSQIIFNDLRLFITTFNDRYSRFYIESDLSRLNDARFIEKPPNEFLKILKFGITLYHDTNEVFNFLVGERMEASGYDPTYSFTPKEASLTTPDPTAVLSLSQKRITLALGRVDIGGYGKGYLIDLIAKRLQKKHHLSYFLINGGGDMYVTSDFGKPVTIYLEHPSIAGTYLAETTLYHEGFAASSTQKRRWESAGQTYTHIIDTKTGNTHDTSLGVFVKAPEAKLADAWATTLLLSAPENHTVKLEEKNIRVALFDGATGNMRYYQGF